MMMSLRCWLLSDFPAFVRLRLSWQACSIRGLSEYFGACMAHYSPPQICFDFCLGWIYLDGMFFTERMIIWNFARPSALIATPREIS
jgi:hypothetical protein